MPLGICSCSARPRSDVNLDKNSNIARRMASLAVGTAVALLLLVLFKTGTPFSGFLGRAADRLRLKQHGRREQTSAYPDYCSLLPGLHGQLCTAYIAGATADEKWTAASQWRRVSPNTFACSGIDMDCLQRDLASTSQGSSSCIPRAHNSSCAGNKYCSHGFCGGWPTAAQQQQQQQQWQQQQDWLQPDAAAQSARHWSAAAAAADGGVQHSHESFMPRILSAESQKSIKSQTSAKYTKTVKSVKSAKSTSALKATSNMKSATAAKSAQAAASTSMKNFFTAISSLKFSLEKPIPDWPTATASVYSGPLGRRVTNTFLATSHEYRGIQYYGDERIVHAWANIFQKLSPSPVIRIGGASQDKLTRAPTAETWLALKKFHKHTNCRFLIGLPLWPKNSMAMARQMMADSKKILGEENIIGYELGNEPEFWPTGLGGWTRQGKWKAGFDAYAAYFHRTALALNPCGKKKLLSGPGWGNVNTQPPGWLAKIMLQGKACYLRELNVHYYPYIDNATVTAMQLLSQPLQDFGLQKYKEQQRIAYAGKLPLRISETNSLYGGGRPALSDTLVGALWVADALFAFANAGAVAFHLHWGVGGDPEYHAGAPNVGVQTNFAFDVRPKEPPLPYPSVHAPWYGYLLWIVAAAGDYGQHTDANFVPARIEQRGKCSANLKIWALKADDGDLRIVFLNKDEGRSCNIKTSVDKQYCKKAAILTRLLPGPNGIYSKGDITWQGQTYENSGWSGKLQGQKRSQALWPKKSSSRTKPEKCYFEVAVPAASGAVLVGKWAKL